MTNKNNVYSVIMAGGSGLRFWPRSRKSNPKQFLNIIGSNSLIADTAKRFRQISPIKNTYIVTAKHQKELIEKQNMGIAEGNIFYEPLARNTLPCIALASQSILRQNREAVIVVTPADHLVLDDALFKDTIMTAADIACQHNGLVTIGIQPTRPATGYGYINSAEEVESPADCKSYRVKQFVEKPDSETARQYLEEGSYFWNSGIFVFKASVFEQSLKEQAPQIFELINKIVAHYGSNAFEAKLAELYPDMPDLSIDYGIMEKSQNVFMVKGDFRWNDLGSWEQVYELQPKDEHNNVIEGDGINLDSKNCYIYSKSGLVATLGVEDLMIIQENGATLVCKREYGEKIKGLVNILKDSDFKEYV